MARDGSTAKYYRERAQRADDLAETCTDPKLKIQFESVARQWEMLAREVENGLLKR